MKIWWPWNLMFGGLGGARWHFRHLVRFFVSAGSLFFGGVFRLWLFANGGRPPVGRPSVVGERGPELFVPRTAGTIVPNHAMGGANVTVNVDASGSSVEGDGPSDQATWQSHWRCCSG